MKKNNNLIKKILEETINDKICSIKYIGLEKLQQIPEYEFDLVYLKIKLFNNKQYDIFIKLIDTNKITETIFCYWYFCNEKYKFDKFNKNRKYYKNTKTNIIEYKKQEYKRKLDIQWLNSKNKVCRSSTIHFVELNKYVSDDGVINKDINSIKNLDLFIGII